MGLSLSLSPHKCTLAYICFRSVVVKNVLKTKEGNRFFRCIKWTVKQSANFIVVVFVRMHANA